MFLIQQLFATCGVHLEWKPSVCTGCHMNGLRIYVAAHLKSVVITANLGGERARFISKADHRDEN
jgi:hypothetical protein